MLPQRNGQFPLKILFVLVFHLLLTHSCRGQSQVVGPSQPIVARVDDDVILPCRLDPAEDAFAMILEWTRPDLNPEFVHMRQAGQDLGHSKNPSYTDRTSVFVDELKHGNISLKLSRVRPSDAGTYRCYLPKMDKDAFVTLVVGADSSPAIVSIDKTSGGVDLQCESEGWYPEPEVSWLDGEGHVLSAGPTETVSGPDGLYTVSSRVTVEERHRNNFTCRVQQKDINQIRETHIYISDDFFEVQSSSSAPIIIILVVLLAFCSVFIFAVFFSVCKWRQIIKNRRRKAEPLLRTDEPVEEEAVKKLSWNPNKLFNEELQRREEAENKVVNLTQEKQRVEDERQQLQTKLERKTQELKEEKKKREEELEDKTKELTEKKRREKELEAEITKLKEEKKKSEEELQKKLEDKTKEVNRLTAEVKTLKEEKENKGKQLVKKNQENQELQEKNQELQKKLTDEKKTSKRLEDLKTQLEAQITELKEEKKKREEELQKKLDDKTKELENLISDQKRKEEKAEEDLNELRTKNQQLTDEKQRVENERQTLQTKLEDKERELTEEKKRRENEWKKLQTAGDKEQRAHRGEEEERKGAEGSKNTAGGSDKTAHRREAEDSAATKREAAAGRTEVYE